MKHMHTEYEETKHTGEVSKKPYEKPAYLVIPLVAEEVLSTGCKISNGPGGAGGNCTASLCVTAGS